MKKIFLTILFTLISYFVFAQKEQVLDFQIDSKFLNDTRKVKIGLPSNYLKDKPTQVIYVFDANEYFHFVNGLVISISEKSKDLMPQTIVVGVFLQK